MKKIPKKCVIRIFNGYVSYRLYKWAMTAQRFDNVDSALDFHKEVLMYNKELGYEIV